MDGINGLYLTLLLTSLVFSAFFCSAETAFIGFQKLRLQHLIETGNRRAKAVAKIMEQPERFLAIVLLGINFFETAAATLATVIAVSLWGENLGAAIATIVVTLLTLVLAEFIPKSLATRFGEKIALAYVGPINFFSIIFYPFVFLLNHLGIRFSRLAGVDGDPKPTISEEEVRAAITIGHREGAVETDTAEMLHNVFEFADRPVREVMAPRPDVIFVEKGIKLADFLEVYAQHPVSRYPIFEERRDNVIGIVSVWDVLMALAKDTIAKDRPIDELIRPAHFVPETKPISELLAEMKEENFQMAIVVDEFGGTAGIASFNQLVEEIVGPVSEGMAGVEKDFEVIDENTFQIDGGMRVDEVNEEMKLELPEGDYETVAGFILHLLHRIPKQGEQIKWKSLKLVITRMSGLKIEGIMVTKEKDSASPETVQTDAESSK